MRRVRLSPEFAQAVGPVEDVVVEVDGMTTRAAIGEAMERLGLEWSAEQVKVLVDGEPLGGGTDLDVPLPDDAEVVVSPLKGNAQAFDNV